MNRNTKPLRRSLSTTPSTTPLTRSNSTPNAAAPSTTTTTSKRTLMTSLNKAKKNKPLVNKKAPVPPLKGPLMTQFASMALVRRSPVEDSPASTSTPPPPQQQEKQQPQQSQSSSQQDRHSSSRQHTSRSPRQEQHHSSQQSHSNPQYKGKQKRFGSEAADDRFQSQMNKFNNNNNRSSQSSYSNQQFDRNGHSDNLQNARHSNDMTKKHFKRQGFEDNHNNGRFNKNHIPIPSHVRQSASQFSANLATNLLRFTDDNVDDRTKRFSEQADKKKKLVYAKMERDDERYANEDQNESRFRSGEDHGHMGKYNQRNRGLTQKQQRDRRLNEIKVIEKRKKQILTQVNSFLLGSSKSRVSAGTYRTTHAMLKTVNNYTNIQDIEAELGNSINNRGANAAAEATKAKKLSPFVITWGKLGLEPFIFSKLQSHPLQKLLSHNFSRSRINHEQRRLRFVQEYLYRAIQHRLRYNALIEAKEQANGAPTPEIDQDLADLLEISPDMNLGEETKEQSDIPDEVLSKLNAKEIIRKIPITSESFDSILESMLSLRTPNPPHDSLYDVEDVLQQALVNADPTTKHLVQVYLKVKKYLNIGQQFAPLRDEEEAEGDDVEVDDNTEDGDSYAHSTGAMKPKKTKKAPKPASLRVDKMPTVPELTSSQLSIYTPSLPSLPSALQIALLPHMLPYKNKDRDYQTISPISMQSFLHLKHQFENDPRELVLKVHDYPDDFLDTYELHGTKEVGLEYLPPTKDTMANAIGLKKLKHGDANTNGDAQATQDVDGDDTNDNLTNKYFRQKEQQTPFPMINGFHPLINSNNYRRLTPAIPTHTYDLIFQHYDQNERIMAYLPGLIQSITSRPVLTQGQINHSEGIKAVIVQPNREACVYLYNQINTMLNSINEAQAVSSKHKQRLDSSGKKDPQGPPPTPYNFNAMRATGAIGRRTIDRIQKSAPDILVLTPQALSQLLTQTEFAEQTAHEKLKYHRRVQRRQAQRLNDQKQIDDMQGSDDLSGLAKLVILKGNLTALQKLHSYGVSFDLETGHLRKLSEREKVEMQSMTMKSLEREEHLILSLKNKYRTSHQFKKFNPVESAVDGLENPRHRRRFKHSGMDSVDFDELMDDVGFDSIDGVGNEEEEEEEEEAEEFEVSAPHGDHDKKFQQSYTRKVKKAANSTEEEPTVADDDKTKQKKGKKDIKKNQDAEDKEFDKVVKEHLAQDPTQNHLMNEVGEEYQSLDKKQKQLFTSIHLSKSLDQQLASINLELAQDFKLDQPTDGNQGDNKDDKKKRRNNDKDGDVGEKVDDKKQSIDENGDNDQDRDPIADNSLYTPKRLFDATTEDLLLTHQRNSNGLTTNSTDNQSALFRFFETDQERDDLKRLYSLKNCSGSQKPLLFNLNWLVMDNAEKLVNFHYNDVRTISLHLRYLRRLQGKYPSHDVSRIVMSCGVVNESSLVVAATALRDAVFVNGCYFDVHKNEETSAKKKTGGYGEIDDQDTALADDEIAIETKAIGSSMSHLVENIDNSTYPVKELFQFGTDALIQNRQLFRADLKSKAKQLVPGLDTQLDDDEEAVDEEMDSDDIDPNADGNDNNNDHKDKFQQHKSSRHAHRVARHAAELGMTQEEAEEHDLKQLSIITKHDENFKQDLGKYKEADIQPNTMSPDELNSSLQNAINSVHLLQQGTLVSPAITHTYLMVPLPRRLKSLAMTFSNKTSNGLRLYNNNDFENASYARKNKTIGFERLKTQLAIENSIKQSNYRNSTAVQGAETDENGVATEEQTVVEKKYITDADGNQIEFFQTGNNSQIPSQPVPQSLTHGLTRREIDSLKQEEIQYNQLIRLQQQQKLEILKSSDRRQLTVIDEHELITYISKKMKIQLDNSAPTNQRGSKGGFSKVPKTNISIPHRNKILKDYHRVELDYARECAKLKGMMSRRKLNKLLYDNELRRAGLKYKKDLAELKQDLSTIFALLNEHREDLILQTAHTVQKLEIQQIKRQYAEQGHKITPQQNDTFEMEKDSGPKYLTKHELHKKITPTRTLVKQIIDATRVKDPKKGKNKEPAGKSDALDKNLMSPLGIPIELPPQLNWWRYHDHPLSRSLRRKQDEARSIMAAQANPEAGVEMEEETEVNTKNIKNGKKNNTKSTKDDDNSPDQESPKPIDNRPHSTHIEYDDDESSTPMIPNGRNVINTSNGIVSYNPKFSALSDLELSSEYLSIQANTIARLHASLKPRSTIVFVPPNVPFEALAMMFTMKKFKPGILHNSQDKTSKKHVQDAFAKHKINLLLCTDHSIHGMADIRADLVVSWGVPTTTQYIYRSQLLSNSSTGAHVSIQEANTGVGGVQHMMNVPQTGDKTTGEDSPALEADEVNADGDEKGQDVDEKTQHSLSKSTHVSSFSSQVPQKTQAIFDEVRDLLNVGLDRSFLINGKLYPAIEEETIEYVKPVKAKHAHHYWDKYSGDASAEKEGSEGQDEEDDGYTPTITNDKNLSQGPGDDVIKFVRAKQIFYSPFPVQITRFTTTDRNQGLVPEFNSVFNNNDVREAIQGDKDLYSTLKSETLSKLNPEARTKYYKSTPEQRQATIVKTCGKTHREELIHLGLIDPNAPIEPEVDPEEEAKRTAELAQKKPRVGLMSKFKRPTSNTSSPTETTPAPDLSTMSPFEALLHKAVQSGGDAIDEQEDDDDEDDNGDDLDNIHTGVTKLQLSSVYNQHRDMVRSRMTGKSVEVSHDDVFVKDSKGGDEIKWGKNVAAQKKSVDDVDHQSFLKEEKAELKDLFTGNDDNLIERGDHGEADDGFAKSVKPSARNKREAAANMKDLTPPTQPIDEKAESEDESNSMPAVRVNPKTMAAIGNKKTKVKSSQQSPQSTADAEEMSDDVDFEFEFDDNEEKLYNNYLTKHKITVSESEDASEDYESVGGASGNTKFTMGDQEDDGAIPSHGGPKKGGKKPFNGNKDKKNSSNSFNNNNDSNNSTFTPYNPSSDPKLQSMRNPNMGAKYMNDSKEQPFQRSSAATQRPSIGRKPSRPSFKS